MSLILKGIDIPSEKEGWQIDLRIHGFDDGTMMVEKLTRNGRPPFKMYRAIQIPKGHGRLIDADALELEKEVELADDWKTAHEIANCVKYAPTILEAET